MAKKNLYQRYDPRTNTGVWQGRQRKGKDIFRSEDRDGIRAGDFKSETSQKTKSLLLEPQIEKPEILIESAVVIGVDKLTAQDIALHEYLLACAREQGIHKGVHEVPLSQLSDYLDVADKERVWKSLERMMSTVVRYNVIDRFTNRRVQDHMISRVAISTNRLTGKTVFQFIIPAFIRFAMLKSRSNAWLDINVFTKFSSKYAARLYPKLALMAGYDQQLRKPWTPTVRELAVFLGYAGPSEDFHIGSFLRVVDKAVAEINEHVGRFETTYDRPKRGSGRGRPVEGRCMFQASDATRDLYACPEGYLPPTTVARIEDRRFSTLQEWEHPTVRMFSQAWQATGIDASDLNDKWRHDVTVARQNPKSRLGAMTGAQLVETLDKGGLQVAFKDWCKLAVMLDYAADWVPPVLPTSEAEFERELTVEVSGGGSWPHDDPFFVDEEPVSEDGDDLRMGEVFDRYAFEAPDLAETRAAEPADEDIPW